MLLCYHGYTCMYMYYSGCDRCNEWYHGDCIDLTQEESNHIKHFYCHICRGESRRNTNSGISKTYCRSLHTLSLLISVCWCLSPQ